MSKSPATPRKTVLGLLAAGLLGATVLTGSMTLLPPAPMAHAEAAQAIDPSAGFADLVDRVMPAVVSVDVKFANASAEDGAAGPSMRNVPPELRDFFDQFPGFKGMPGGKGPQRGPSAGTGSGFFISADGYVVTNNHVVKDANEVMVRTQNGDEYKATVIGTDPKTDLALIKVKADKAFPFVQFADTPARVGDWVMAVGNPFGLGGTVTTGIVSARGRDIGSGPYDDFLQIDASINKGNSGGPAFNLAGQVIGVNTAIYSPSGGSVGIGFAIPANITRDVVDSLKANGAVTRGWLGVQIQPVTQDIADSLGLKEAKGAIISEVTQDSPGMKAGLKSGDTILKLNGEEVADARDLARKVAKVQPGKTVPMEIMRGGKPMTLDVAIGTMPGQTDASAKPGQPAQNESSALAALGLKLQSAPDGTGVAITDVDPDSVASQRGLQPGDVILEVAGTQVNNPADVKDAIAKVAANRVLLLVKSGDGQRFVALPKDKG